MKKRDDDGDEPALARPQPKFAMALASHGVYHHAYTALIQPRASSRSQKVQARSTPRDCRY